MARIEDDIKPYFTEELFENIGWTRSLNLARFAGDAVSGRLSDYNEDRKKDMKRLLDIGPFFSHHEDDYEYFERELKKTGEAYGFEKDKIIDFIQFSIQNPDLLSNIHEDDVDLLGHIYISSPTFIENFSQDIEYYMKFSRGRDFHLSEFYAVLPNRMIADYYELLAENSLRNGKSEMPIFPFSPSLLQYDIENKMNSPDFEGRLFDIMRYNIENARQTSEHVWSFLEDPNEKFLDFVTDRDRHGQDLDGFVSKILKIFKRWDKVVVSGSGSISFSGEPFYDFPSPDHWRALYNEDLSTRQVISLMTLAAGEHIGHFDAFSDLSNFYNTLVGNNVPHLFASYPLWLEGRITQTNGLVVNDNILDILDITEDEVLGSFELYGREHNIIALPWTTKSDAKKVGVPEISITSIYSIGIYSIDDMPLGNTTFPEIRERVPYLYDYIKRTPGTDLRHERDGR